MEGVHLSPLFLGIVIAVIALVVMVAVVVVAVVCLRQHQKNPQKHSSYPVNIKLDALAKGTLEVV